MIHTNTMGFPMRILSVIFVLFLTACGGGPSPTPSVTSNCALKTYVSTYPASYLGSNPIPTPIDKFDSSVMRGVGVKDYYPVDNNNCSTPYDYARLLYNATLDRLKSINVDTVEIYQYGPVDNFNASVWTVNPANLQIPVDQLIWFVNQAHSKGLKVTLVWQLWNIDSKGNVINTNNPTESEMVTVLRGWHDVITNIASFAGLNHFDNLNIQWEAFYYPVVTTYPETATQEFLTIISDIRKVFNGKLFMGTPRFYDQRIISQVDAIVVPLYPSNWSYVDDLNMSVSLLKQRFMDSITGIYLDFALYSGMNPINIPIIWDFNIQSRDKALSQGWVEDGFCVALGTDTPIAFGPSCMQLNYVTDFSVQAQAIEGAFEAIKSQPYFKTYGVNFSTGYWHTDTIVPGPEGFPNYSQSIRGKPSENIVKYWYQK